MKTILVLTDFSDNAANAAKTAIMLGGRIHANILLYHNYQTITVSSYYGGGIAVAEDVSWAMTESKKRLNKLINDLQYLVNDLDQTARKPTLHSISDEGDIGENIKNIIKKNEIEFIVMGAGSNSTVDHLFFGSETNAVIRYATCPVLVVPQQITLKELRKVAFATEFEETDLKAIHYLIRLGKIFHFELNIIHVNQPEVNKSLQEEKETNFKKSIAKFKYLKTTFNDIRGQEVVTRLYHHCEETEQDCLALVHHHESFFTRMLQHSTTREALANQKTPLFIFPSEA
jgi:nucleotide-binding universal stress UspA family protein